MRLRDFPAATLRKFRTPSTWGAILAFGIFWALLRAVTHFQGALSSRAEFLVPFLVLTGNLALAPLPWLWTGDDRKLTPAIRGFLQSVPWNLIWLLGMVALLNQVAPFPTHDTQPVTRLEILDHSFVLRPEWGFCLFNFPFTMMMGWFLAGKEAAEAKERELQDLADRTRARALQSQLNPHVLFNTLGGITELVHEDPDAAEEALVGLVEMYRELTRHGAALQAPLRQERSLLKRYLEIESIRLGGRLELEWSWPEWADPIELPPLLLQPLVENAIKHGISPSTKGGRLRLKVGRTAESLILEVANTGKPLKGGAPEGTGLANLRERLTLMRELKPDFCLAQEGEWVVARLTLAWRWPV